MFAPSLINATLLTGYSKVAVIIKSAICIYVLKCTWSVRVEGGNKSKLVLIWIQHSTHDFLSSIDANDKGYLELGVYQAPETTSSFIVNNKQLIKVWYHYQCRFYVVV